ncbi:hypothetical protein FRC17_010303 [Serendipita sp. 399]|nr:hypothetical protein FRC17_010303 [Serendipita sp. 399]
MSAIIASTLGASNSGIFSSMKSSLSSLFFRLQAIESLEAASPLSHLVASSLSGSEQQISDLSRQLCSKIDDYLELREPLLGSSAGPVPVPTAVLFSPISLCPDEVLGYIFEAIIDDGSHNLHPLLTVNRRFHRLIMSTPRLWSKIFIRINIRLEDVNSLSTSYITTCLERSGEVLLDIVMNCDGIRHTSEFLEHYAFEALEAMELEKENKRDVLDHVGWACGKLGENGDRNFPCPFYDRKMDNVVEIVYILMSQAHRWRSAIIHPPDPSYTERGARNMFTCKMPNLQSLEINYYDFALLSELIPESPWPKLTEFAFTSRIDLSKASLNLSQLRSLTFKHYDDRFDFSNMSILSECISLQKLDIHCNFSFKKEKYPPIDVRLPRLKFFSLSGSMESISYVHFILPELEHWDLSCDLRRYIPDVDAHHVSWQSVWSSEEISAGSEVDGVIRLFSRFKKTVSVALNGLKHLEFCIRKFEEMTAAKLLPGNLRAVDIAGVTLLEFTRND